MTRLPMIKLAKWSSYAFNAGIAVIRLLLTAGIAHFLRRWSGYRGYWLVAERHDEARDNGYHFFKFLQNNHPDLKAFYVIEPSAPDAARVAAHGPVIAAGGWKHYLYYTVCEVAVSTHIYGASPERRAAKFLRHLLPNKKVVLLGHGIWKDHFAPFDISNTKVDLLCVGALPEFHYLKANCGYAEHALVYTGLPRYDALLNVGPSRRLILIMPTFRKWLHELSLLPATMKSEAFQQEPFYKEFQCLLSSTSFIELLSSFDLNAVFYPHYRMQPFIDEFVSASDRIILARRQLYDVQTLLKESTLLITDYSSVFFDFAYMQKPVVFFQFKDDAYRTGHYKEGYFSYERDGFGPVVDSVDDVVEVVRAACASGFAVPETYRMRTDRFFPLRDGGNCERVYDAIGRSLEN